MDEILLAQITLIASIVILCFGLGYMYNEDKTYRRRQKMLDRVNKLLEEDLKELVSEHEKHNAVNMSSFKEGSTTIINPNWKDHYKGMTNMEIAKQDDRERKAKKNKS